MKVQRENIEVQENERFYFTPNLVNIIVIVIILIILLLIIIY